MQDLSLAPKRFDILIIPGKAGHSLTHCLNLLENSCSARDKCVTAGLQ